MKKSIAQRGSPREAGAILPFLIVGLLLVGIVVGTGLVKVPQIFKPKASELTPTSAPPIPSIFINCNDAYLIQNKLIGSGSSGQGIVLTIPRYESGQPGYRYVMYFMRADGGKALTNPIYLDNLDKEDAVLSNWVELANGSYLILINVEKGDQKLASSAFAGVCSGPLGTKVPLKRVTAPTIDVNVMAEVRTTFEQDSISLLTSGDTNLIIHPIFYNMSLEVDIYYSKGGSHESLVKVQKIELERDTGTLTNHLEISKSANDGTEIVQGGHLRICRVKPNYECSNYFEITKLIVSPASPTPTPTPVVIPSPAPSGGIPTPPNPQARVSDLKIYEVRSTPGGNILTNNIDDNLNVLVEFKKSKGINAVNLWIDYCERWNNNGTCNLLTGEIITQKLLPLDSEGAYTLDWPNTHFKHFVGPHKVGVHAYYCTPGTNDCVGFPLISQEVIIN